MNAIETGLKDCFILEPRVFGDSRGYFFESYNKSVFKEATGLDVDFVQDNQSFSTKAVLRGLHAQAGEFAQAKLVRVLQGEVLDVAVDARPDSNTFGKHVAVLLSAENKRQLFVPRGFLHGFIVLSETAEFSYKCDNLYNKDAEWGVIYNDSQLNIDWSLPTDNLLVSNKDRLLPSFEDAIAQLKLKTN
ncbi:dTDP-4-dehydrorhamnose 3,5-epimerase [Sphingobacterium daejeonense]|uniref:dTDP-4-dehydrorhamnose 3,5-epimerase n=1 Tax=Sphingobacterium daejeonense TaxID=371142 RepID=UPI0021A94EA2|nr:dTDP-4-dehydrorhamnose 3,5-epimerase [Sphingobacterium daejeonense]MCT1532658.1 dTDP-4-dehydrorhamnose 3,5-epimerase [Sphingobacterium daejeonense]